MNLFLKVNTTNCDEVKDLNDDSGNYIKSVCLVAIDETYNGADEKCQSYGMSLYNVDTSEAKKALLDFSTTRFKPLLGVVLYIQGKTSVGCNILYNGEGLFDVFPDDDCYYRCYFYCQFTQTPTAQEPGKQRRKN
jgi:hypothetical protein